MTSFEAACQSIDGARRVGPRQHSQHSHNRYSRPRSARTRDRLQHNPFGQSVRIRHKGFRTLSCELKEAFEFDLLRRRHPKDNRRLGFSPEASRLRLRRKMRKEIVVVLDNRPGA